MRRWTSIFPYGWLVVAAAQHIRGWCSILVLRRTYTVYGVCVSLASSASDDALQLGTLVVAVLQHEDGLAGRGRCVGDDRRRAIGRR